MSAADRMVVRTPDGAYRSVPRRQGLGMIAAGRAQHAPVAGAPADLAELLDAERRRLLPADKQDLYRHPLDGVDPVDLLPDIVTKRGSVVYPEHVSVELDAAEKAVSLPGEPRGNASRAEWATYAVSLGVEVTDGMTRNKIRDAAQDVAQSLDRLPQPALPGGRLETPEDEPAAERLADDEDPGTR